jgi:uncharacterized repeat protein (TIGR01451 family)
LTPDLTGTAAAIWEVVNANSGAPDTLTFSVYVGYSSPTVSPDPANWVALSYAPEPGGGTFSIYNNTQGQSNAYPRFEIIKTQSGSWLTLNSCSLSATTSTQALSSTGGSSPSTTIPLTISPATLPVTAVPSVTTPANGTWLSASISGATLTISGNPTGLAASPTPYSGSVTISAPGVSAVTIPVTLTVNPTASLSALMTNLVTFTQGQLNRTYSVVVSNASGAGPTSSSVKVTEQLPSGLYLVGMSGIGWDCTAITSCSSSQVLNGGANSSPITITVDVDAQASSPQASQVTVSGGGSPNAIGADPTPIAPFTCAVSGDVTAGLSDVNYILQEVLGLTPPKDDLNRDLVINILDAQKVVNAAVTQSCTNN